MNPTRPVGLHLHPHSHNTRARRALNGGRSDLRRDTWYGGVGDIAIVAYSIGKSGLDSALAPDDQKAFDDVKSRGSP